MEASAGALAPDITADLRVEGTHIAWWFKQVKESMFTSCHLYMPKLWLLPTHFCLLISSLQLWDPFELPTPVWENTFKKIFVFQSILEITYIVGSEKIPWSCSSDSWAIYFCFAVYILGKLMKYFDLLISVKQDRNAKYLSKWVDNICFFVCLNFFFLEPIFNVPFFFLLKLQYILPF